MTTDASETTDEASGADPSVADLVARLQEHDSAIDRLVHRRDHLEEHDTLTVATGDLRAWEHQRTKMRARLDELAGAVEQAEADAAEFSAEEARLAAQLKTVIAPREAEALMSEIETVTGKRDAVETQELEALEEQAALDDTLTDHLGDEQPLRDAMSAADEAYARVVADIDEQIAAVTVDRDAARADLSESLLARYDRIRASSGTAVAELNGRRCEGCHLDLSAAEVDDVKDEARANDGIADCPQCGRMLRV